MKKIVTVTVAALTACGFSAAWGDISIVRERVDGLLEQSGISPGVTVGVNTSGVSAINGRIRGRAGLGEGVVLKNGPIRRWGIEEERADRPHGWGYFFIAPGAVEAEGSYRRYFLGGTWHLGGGFERALYKGLGLGAELGYLAPMEVFGEGIGVFSFNGTYHFGGSAKVAPFGTSGYSWTLRGESIKFWNIGAGVNYWFSKRSALRLEVRDHLVLGESVTIHFLGLRLGLSFR